MLARNISGWSYLNVELSTVVKIGHRPAPLVTCFHLLIRESMFFLLSIFFIKEPIDILPEKRTDEYGKI